MKYCPKCRSEYHDEVDKCADCLLPLTDTLPPKREIEWDELAVIYHTDSPYLAQLLRIELHENNIITYLENEYFGSMMPIPSIADVQIAVHPEDEEKARKIVEEFEAPRSEEND